jgi:hypothetical protein
LNGDQNASLSLKDGNQGIIYKCFAGCAPDAIRNALKEKFGWVEPALESRSCRNSNFYLPYAYRGSVVCAGIHMSDIPSFPYRSLWQESACFNATRR